MKLNSVGKSGGIGFKWLEVIVFIKSFYLHHHVDVEVVEVCPTGYDQVYNSIL